MLYDDRIIHRHQPVMSRLDNNVPCYCLLSVARRVGSSVIITNIYNIIQNNASQLADNTDGNTSRLRHTLAPSTDQ